MSDGAVVLAEVVRSGFVEGHHYGSAVVVDPDGSVVWSAGVVDRPMLPRSSNKPIQATAMVAAGLRLEPELLALASASHSGEPRHLEGVLRILNDAGLTADHLQTPADHPLDDVERDRRLAAGEGPSSLAMNCSGKHAAMLATCRVNDWDVAGYLDPGHPLQKTIAHTFEDLTGGPVAHVAVDGCGAPLLGTSLVGLARAYSRMVVAGDGPEREVADAIRAFPEMTSGTRRDEARLIRAIPGSIGKAGAESVYAVGLPDGRAIAVKCDDGAARVRPVLMAAILERLGVLDLAGVDADGVRATGRKDILGGGDVVGEVRAVL